MNEEYYLRLYGLAEALALCLAVALFFGYKWWKLFQANRRLERACAQMPILLKQRSERAKLDSKLGKPAQESWAAHCKALAALFERRRIDRTEDWEAALETLGQSLAKLTPAEPPAPQPSPVATTAIAATPEEGAAPEPDPPAAAAGLAMPELDAEIGKLLDQHSRGVASLNESHTATMDLRRKCEDIKLANQNLRIKLESVAKQDRTGQLRQILDEVEQSNLDLQQMALAAEHQHSGLGAQLDALGQQIHNLQITIRNYRKSLQKLLLERDALIGENKEHLRQLETKTRLIERLNRNYDALRREYTKLYEATR